MHLARPSLLLPLLLTIVGATEARGRPATPADPGRIRLTFTGDVALNWRGTPEHWKTFPWRRNPLRFLKPIFDAADLAVANMEGVLMRKDPKYAEKRLNLWAPVASAQVFKPAGIHLVSTANNHAFDGRDVGVLETLRHLRGAGVRVIGTGRTMAEARTPFLFRKAPACVAIVPGTTKSNMGVRGRARVAFYPEPQHDALLRTVRDTKKQCPLVIVYLHWGTEKAHHPGRKIKALGHRLVEAGANLVVGHHPHVLQGVEFRPGGAVVYSLGNMVFSNPTPATRRTGVLWVELSRERNPHLLRLELIPIVIRRSDYTPLPATRPQAEDLVRRMQRYCRPLGTQVVLYRGRLRFMPNAAVQPPVD